MNTISETEIKNTIADVLSRRVYLPNAAPEAIEIKTVQPGQLYHFHLRLDKNFGVLPLPETVKKTYEQTGKKGAGARYLMLGVLQVVGGKVRATARIVETESSAIQRAGMGDGEMSADGLAKAFEQALIKLGINYVA